jgi:hypothetical protein
MSITKSHMTRPEFEPGSPQWKARQYITYNLSRIVIGSGIATDWATEKSEF